MYCIQCGVELARGERVCPLCHTRVCHPDFPPQEAFPPYPDVSRAPEKLNPRWVMLALTVLLAQPVLLSLLIDLRMHGTVSWSGYVTGSIGLAYVIALLPAWFRRPNPVIFVPVDFAAVLAFLLYVDIYTAGGWFLSFAFPVVGIVGLIVTAAVALFRYARHGSLYIISGLFFALGGFSILLEFFISITFHVGHTFNWSLYPAASSVIFGAVFLVIAICRPLRESLHKRFFL